MEDFAEKLINDVQQTILKQIVKTEFIMPDYGSRKVLPEGFISQMWEQVNWDNVLKTVKPEMEKRICNSIIGTMDTEIKTDVKKLMAVDGVRQKLRMEVYPKLMKALES